MMYLNISDAQGMQIQADQKTKMKLNKSLEDKIYTITYLLEKNKYLTKTVEDLTKTKEDECKKNQDFNQINGDINQKII